MKCIEQACGADYDPREIQIALGNLFGKGVPSPGRCPKCLKAYRDAEPERERAAEAVRQAGVAAKRREWRQTSGIPSLFMDKDFSNFDEGLQPGAYKAAWQYAENFPLGKPWGYGWMVMASFVKPGERGDSNGLGKTHLACSIMHRLLDRWQGEDIRRPAFFITEPDLITSIQATYSLSVEEKSLRESESEIINRLASEPLLVLDDVGKIIRTDRSNPKALTTPFVQEKLFLLIDLRYRAKLPMIITTNFASEDLETYLGTAAMDRIVEMIGGSFKRLKGKSYRRDNP